MGSRSPRAKSSSGRRSLVWPLWPSAHRDSTPRPPHPMHVPRPLGVRAGREAVSGVRRLYHDKNISGFKGPLYVVAHPTLALRDSHWIREAPGVVQRQAVHVAAMRLPREAGSAGTWPRRLRTRFLLSCDFQKLSELKRRTLDGYEVVLDPDGGIGELRRPAEVGAGWSGAEFRSSLQVRGTPDGVFDAPG